MAGTTPPHMNTHNAVHWLRDTCGFTIGQIAAALNIAPPSVFMILAESGRYNGKSKSRRADAGTTESRCATCDRACASDSTRCSFCAKPYRHGLRDGLAAERVRILTSIAEFTGEVPSVAEAMSILRVGRSVAGAAIHDAFGPDDRPGARRSGPRPYPPRS